MIPQIILSMFSLVLMVNKVVAYDAVIEQALQLQNPMIVKAFDQEKEFRHQTIEHLQSTARLITDKASFLNEDEIESLKQRCLKRVERDEAYLPDLNNFITKNRFSLGSNVKCHKIKECLEGAKTLLNSDFGHLVYGEPIAGYEILQDSCPILQWNDTGIWGNSKGTYLKTAYYLLLKELQENNGWLDVPTSPLYHTASLLVDASDLEGFSFLHDNDLLFPHSGYAFGGHRFDKKYPQGKKFGPEDCSSWISKMYDTPFSLAFSTADALCTYRQTLGLNDFVPPTWSLSPDGVYLPKHFTGVPIEGVENFKPGMIYVHRGFPDTDPTMSTTLGTGGHTALVIGVENNSIITIGYNRDMSNIEGFGIQPFPFQAYPKFIFSLSPVL